MKFGWEGGRTGGPSQNALIFIRFKLKIDEIRLESGRTGGRREGLRLRRLPCSNLIYGL